MKRVAPGRTLLAILLVTGCADRADPTSPAPNALVAPTSAITIVMSNLDSPRGLGWGPEGGLYVTEAGNTTSTGQCTQFMEGMALATRCYSGTGSITRLWKGTQERVVTGLPSSFIVQSGFSAGPQDISFQGRGNAYVAIGLGGHPALRANLGADAQHLGTLIRVQPSGGWTVVADIAGFEAATNPDGRQIDSNPYGVLAEAAGQYVVDAGGNSVVEVAASGAVTLVATFPMIPAPAPFGQAESVPTKIKRGPDGALYVSTLAGVPFADGAAGIFRLVPGQTPQLYEGGFKMITDFAFAPDGGLYVLQFATAPLFLGGAGALIHVAPDGTRSVVTTDLFHPTGVTTGPDGSIYVANKGTMSGAGEVLRISP
jgi:hypothetical protein